MVNKTIHIEIFGWEVQILEIQNDYDCNVLEQEMKRFSIDEDEIDGITEQIKTGVTDGGWHYYNEGMRKSMIIVYPTTSIQSRINVICHEKRHCEDRILSVLNIKDIETSAYLAGFLAEKLI